MLRILCMVIYILLTSCSDGRLTPAKTNDMKPEMTYIKDSYGNCYSVIENGYSWSNNYAVSHTTIPCEKSPLK